MISSRRITSNTPNNISKLIDVLPKVKKIFATESSVVRPSSGSTMIVADLHGDIATLNYLLQTRERRNCNNIVFMGDYVDRGAYGVEVLTRLFQLKLSSPKRVILLRGNHEDQDINMMCGFFNQIGNNKELMAKIESTYDKLPISAIVAKSIFCVHGGIGKSGSLRHIAKRKDTPYTWNDPSVDTNGITSSILGDRRKMYGEDVVDSFLKKNDLSMIVRGHTSLMNGYMWVFENKLLSLFSIPNYLGYGNKGAYAIVDDGKIEIFTFDAGLASASKRSSRKLMSKR